MITPDAPRIVQAASLGLAIMAKTKLPWREVINDMPSAITLSPEQWALVQEFSPVLDMLTIKGVQGATSTRTIFVCQTCGRWGFISEGQIPKRCGLTIDCPGENIKASASATQSKKPANAGTNTPDEDK